MNKKIIDEFTRLIEYRKTLDQENEKFRLRAFNQVINIVKSLPYDIKSSADLDGIKGIGPKSKIYVDQIIKKGHIKEIEDYVPSEKDFDFTTILGVGPAKAKEFLSIGAKSIGDLISLNTKRKISLTNTQNIGIKYYDDLQKRIPYDEIKKYNDIFLRIIDCFNKYLNVKTILEVTGSFRRGKSDSHDIDVVVAISSKKDHKSLFVNTLKIIGLIVEDINDGSTKYLGLVRIKGYPVRHIDIEFTSYTSFPFATLYFTGSKEFNVAMRAFAKAHGYLLNHEGLYDKRTNSLVNWDFKIERDIFQFLNYPYREPKNR